MEGANNPNAAFDISGNHKTSKALEDNLEINTVILEEKKRKKVKGYKT